MASMFFPFRIILCFFVHFPLGSFGFICPGPVNPPNGISYARIESNISGRAEEVYEKIRIKLSYDASIEGKPYQGLVQEAADFWVNVLSVKPVDGRLFKSRDCESIDKANVKISGVSGKRAKFCLGSCSNTTKCDEIIIPQEHLAGCNTCTKNGPPCDEDEPEPGAGIDNADLVFYVASINSETCRSGLVVAYSGYCDLEPVLDRPVFVLINICPITKASNSNDMKAMLWTIKHEMMHAFGFNALLFARFRDKEGNPLWPRDQVGEPITNEVAAKQKVVNYIDREWHVRGGRIIVKRAFLATPNVKREAQNHFGCLDLEGAELEDYGNIASKLGHFEARVFYDDAMRADTAGKGLFSRLDFAVLEDSGWYQVNYSQAEEMDFGRNLGCDFCMKSCKFWMDREKAKAFTHIATHLILRLRKV